MYTFMKEPYITKKGEIAKKILTAIGIAGLMVVAMSSPIGVRGLYKALWRQVAKKVNSRRALIRSLNNLRRRGLLKLVQTPHGYRLELTEKGRVELLAYEIGEKLLKKPKRWDNKWRLIIFDIAEKHRKRRDDIRRTLVGLGFFRLQDSVWVHPYDCEEVLELLRTKHHVRHEALFVQADSITNHKLLRQHFNLV